MSWASIESIHLTLKFLGEVDEARAAELAEALERATFGIAPIGLEVEGVGAFPDPARPRVVWAGVKASPELARLQGRVEEEMSALGFEREPRPFTPHLTLCRIKSPADSRALGRLIAQIEPRLSAAFRAASVVLFKSVLRPTGAEHMPLREIALRG